MPNPFIAFFSLTALGLLLVWFSSRTYSSPEKTQRRWFSYLPKEDWVRKLIRCLSIFCTFGAILVTWQGFLYLPFLVRFRGPKLTVPMLASAIFVTWLLLPRKVSRRSVGDQIDSGSRAETREM